MRLSLPDPELLRSAPESAALTLLDFGLALADTALRLEHADRIPHCPLPPSAQLLAELLLDRCLELRNLIARYNTAIDDALGLETDFDGGL